MRTRPQYLKILFFVILFFALAGSTITSAGTAEKILDFKSHIVINPDSSITVTETIQVTAAGKAIKRGIFREFPTTYKDRYRNTVRVRFEVVKVLRDGQPEPFHIRDRNNGKAVYIGRKDRFLEPGQYSYTIQYRTARQIGFFEEFDELYWNVTGDGWRFPIEHAEVLIELPPGAEILQYAVYTGRTGEQDQDFQSVLTEGNAFSVATSRSLGPGEGLTVAVAWPKGHVREPAPGARMGLLLIDNRSLVAAGIGLLLLLSYYIGAWFSVGRDPAKGTIIPRFKPPKDLSPAALRYLMRMGFDQKCFAAAVVNLAVKGALDIVREGDGDFSLKKKGPENLAHLSRGEKLLLRKLFGQSRSLQLENKNHARISKAIKSLKNLLKLDFEKVYFLRNFGYFIPGVVLTGLTLLIVVLTARNLPVAGFMSIWLSMWTIGSCVLGFKVFQAWRAAIQGGVKNILKHAGAVGLTLFSIPFFAGEAFGLTVFANAVSPFAIVIFLAALVVNLVFYHLLKAPTLLGRRLMDEAEGFRMYLNFAEKDRLDILNPPDETPELFEKYLPYALAFGVENQWNQRFARVLEEASENEDYQPSWYHSRSWVSGDVTHLGSSLGAAFAGAISSSSTAPGSSSGSGGGGSSGGGGGGGGGGGW